MTKVTTGRSGAVRIEPLEMNDLTRAEIHGKRLDESSKARAIYPNAPPLTTTGLDLKQLYREHVDGIFIPKNNTKALHVIVQFPTELVDGEDAEYMLKHARGFLGKVFGERAIFADRVDRDERGRHIVDCFLAPIYRKETKHTHKDAVGLSVHTKKLANQYYPEETRIKPDGKVREINVHDIGRALQDALFDYFRLDMGLEHALRGSPKLTPGPDWKAAEELRLQELEDLKDKALAKERLADQMRHEAEAAKAIAVGYEKEAEAARGRQERDADDWQLAVQLAEQDRIVTLAERKRADEARLQAEMERAKAEKLRIDAEANARRTTDEARRTQDIADRLLAQAQGELAATEKKMEDVEKGRLTLRQEREALAIERQRDRLRLDLLERAMDDSSGLNLRPTKDGFAMDAAPMSPAEREAFVVKWPKALFEIARRLADALDKLKKLLRTADSFDRRERDASKVEAELRQRRAALIQAEGDLEAKAIIVAEQVKSAHRDVSRAQEMQQAAAEWSNLLALVAYGQINLKKGTDEKWKASSADGEIVPDRVKNRLQFDPPTWFERSLDTMMTLGVYEAQVRQQQREAAAHAAKLKSVVEQADRAFTSAQKEAVNAAGKMLAMEPTQLAARLAEQRGRSLG